VFFPGPNPKKRYLGQEMRPEDKAEAERQADLFEFKEDPWETQ
jgi:hypothetical protein